MLNIETIKQFNCLLRAARAGHLMLLDCTDAQTGAPAAALCAIEGHPGALHAVPFATMLVGDPLRQLVPPADDDLKRTNWWDEPAAPTSNPPP